MGSWNGYSEQSQGSQERGPGSFTIQPPEAVDSRARGTATLQANNYGGLVPVTPQSRQMLGPPDDTMAALLAAGGEVFGKAVAANRDEQFLRGMQQAASGKALTEIVNDEPWYSKIFGGGAVADGARTFTANKQATQWIAAQEANMSELRKFSPDEIPKYVIDSTKKLMTGDERTDMQVQGAILQKLPALIERHTKENYKYTQEQTSHAWTENVQATATMLQERMRTDKELTSPESRSNARDTFLFAIDPSGMDSDTYTRAVKNNVGLLAEAGNWHAIGVLREAGMFKQMKPEDRLAVESTINRYAEYHRTQPPAQPYLIEHAVLMEKAQNDPRYSGEQYLKDVAKINQRYTQETGNPIDLLGSNVQVHGAQTAMQAQYNLLRASQAQQRKIEDGLDKVAARESAVNSTLSHLFQGQAQELKNLPGGPKTDVIDEAFMRGLQQLDPQQRTRFIVANSKGGYVNEQLKDRLRSPLNSLADQPDGTFLAIYKQYAALADQPDGGGATALYFGEEHDARLAQFHMLMKTDPNSLQQNYTLTMKNDRPRVTLTKEERDGLHKDVGSLLGVPGKALTGPASMLVEKSAGIYKQYAGTMGKDQWAEKTLQVAKANGLEAYGNYSWIRPQQGQALPLATVTQVPEGELSGLVKSVVQDKLKGTDVDYSMIQRLPDTTVGLEKVANFTIFTNKGATTFTSQDLQTSYRKRFKRPEPTANSQRMIDTNEGGAAFVFPKP